MELEDCELKDMFVRNVGNYPAHIQEFLTAQKENSYEVDFNISGMKVL
jgi:hypothetical protein